MITTGSKKREVQNVPLFIGVLLSKFGGVFVQLTGALLSTFQVGEEFKETRSLGEKLRFGEREKKE